MRFKHLVYTTRAWYMPVVPVSSSGLKVRSGKGPFWKAAFGGDGAWFYKLQYRRNAALGPWLIVS